MAQQWYLSVSGEIAGPYSAKQLRAMARTGEVAADSRVSLDREKWFRAAQIKGLLPDSAPAPEGPAASDPGASAPPKAATPAGSRIEASSPAQAGTASPGEALLGRAPRRSPSAAANWETQALGPTSTDDARPNAPGAGESLAPAAYSEDPIQAEIRRTLAQPLGAIPGYEILSVLGRGGMGVVYAARHLKLDRVVAIKTLLVSRIESPTMLARFEQEARTIAKLRHLNVVTAYDFGQHEGRLYLVLELLEGESLEAVLERGERLDERIAWSLARQAASGLAHATQLGIVHRDVKPGNLMLTAAPDGLAMPTGVSLVKVTDFGIALLQTEAGGSMRLTGQFVAMGTPLYMAPEQASGESVDCRADIYALGATVYHLLSGRPPFEGETPIQLVLAKLNTTAAPLAESHGVSPETDQLLADMLAADKTRRIADYDTLLARIDALPVYHDAYPVPGTGGATTGARTATPAASTIGTLASGAATTRATRSLAHTEYVEAAPSASAAVPLPETTNVASPARRAPVGAIAGGLGIALLLAAGVFFGLRPASLPAKPLEMATGYEQPLFDGRGLEQWLPAQGSWRADVDEEGGAILRGAGVARRPIPPLKNFSVSAAVRPRTAKAVELRFAIRDPSEIDGPCYAIRLADGFATLIERRPGAPGVTLSPVTIPLPDVTEDETRAPYLSIRIERQGDVWWAFCEDQPIGAARVRADEASEIRLTATGGEAFFEEITLAELTDVKK